MKGILAPFRRFARPVPYNFPDVRDGQTTLISSTPRPRIRYTRPTMGLYSTHICKQKELYSALIIPEPAVNRRIHIRMAAYFAYLSKLVIYSK